MIYTYIHIYIYIVARKTPASKGGGDAEVEEGKADGVGEELVHALQQKTKKKKAVCV